MRRLLSIASAAVLALTAASGATAFSLDSQDKGRGEQSNGKGPGGDRGGPDRGGPERGGPERGPGNGRAERNDDRGPERGPGRDDRGPQRAESDDERREVRREQYVRRELDRARDRLEVRDVRRDDRRYDDRRNDDRRYDDRDVRVIERVILGRPVDRGLIRGCPPGLARKNNGCLPPGQMRQFTPSRYDYLWDRRNDDYRYRYDNGYLYRTDSQGGLLGYLPLLGGALGLGQVWPTQYDYQPAPTYYTQYYGLGDRYDYRYADGVLYGLDPQTQSISQVAALLTGQSWNVGQRMPAGYDVYNVPYGYRDRYADSADSWYRYNDGYVYQVDPTTQLVQAVIQLLT